MIDRDLDNDAPQTAHEALLTELEAENETLRLENNLLRDAIRCSIALADDHADSGISKPIRDVMKELSRKVPAEDKP